MLRVLIAALLLGAACSGEGGDANGAQVASLALDTAGVPAFSADAAYALIQRQVEFGPRVPGTAGHAAQLAWMTQLLRERADTVALQPFAHETGEGARLELTNVFARFRPAEAVRVLLVAHWDTRPGADMETDAARRELPIPGANDGASGAAVLLELANVLSRHSPPIGVDLLFVDGEDYGPGGEDMYLGAKYFAAHPPAAYRPLYGVLVDMVADRSPVFFMEGNSRDMAPEVVERVWRIAEQIGLGHVFVRSPGGYITDDHVHLNRGGFRTIDIIDFDFGPGNSFWHTHQDALENTAPGGPGAVGRVLTTLIFNGG
jgi:glutaminyl-peptide cyclotransferase